MKRNAINNGKTQLPKVFSEKYAEHENLEIRSRFQSTYERCLRLGVNHTDPEDLEGQAMLKKRRVVEEPEPEEAPPEVPEVIEIEPEIRRPEHLPDAFEVPEPTAPPQAPVTAPPRTPARARRPRSAPTPSAPARQARAQAPAREGGMPQDCMKLNGNLRRLLQILATN